MIIVIEGIDGSGKSTVAPLVFDKLQDRFPGSTYITKRSIETSDPLAKEHLNQLVKVIWKSKELSRDMLGPRHWIHLIAAWYHAFDTLVLDPLRKENRLAVLDGWYFRNIVKTCLRLRCTEKEIRRLFDGIRNPDLTVLLDVSPEVAWSRSKHFKPTELGRWDGFQGDGRTSFLAYQALIRGKLRIMQRRQNWHVCAPSAHDSPAQVAQLICDSWSKRFDMDLSGMESGVQYEQ